MEYFRSTVILLLTLGIFFTQAYTRDSFSFDEFDAKTDSTCVVDLEDDKLCKYRESNVQSYRWNHITGFYCYNYTNDYRLNFRYLYGVADFLCPKDDGNVTKVQFYVSPTDEKQLFWYDYTNETSLEHIRKSFKTQDYFDLWKMCAEESRNCCDNQMNETNIFPSSEYPCNVVWDGWSCFPQAKAETVSNLVCSQQAYSTTSKVCVLYSEKQCTKDGWNQDTDYKGCAIAPVLRARQTFHVIFLYVSMSFALPAVVIFTAFSRFRSILRICLHRNLMIVIIIRNILTIMTKEIILLDALQSGSNANHVMDDNGVWCRVLAFFENAAKNGIYACMLVDGFYLHKLIVRAFSNEPQKKYLYGVALILTFVPSIIWAILRGVNEAKNCWMIDTTGDQWVSDGFRFAILACNTLLLLDIVRVMLTKLKHGSTSDQAKTTFRATLFLIPLFGINIIVTSNRDIVASDSCFAEDIFYYTSYSLEALQGVFVSLLFCYLNAEVHTEIQNAYRKFVLHVQQKYGWEINNDLLRRRTTVQSFVNRPSVVEESSKNYRNLHESAGNISTVYGNRLFTSVDDNETSM